MREACILLNVLLGSAMLLLQSLEGDDWDAAREVLADIGVHRMTPEVATMVLKTRTDVGMQ